jgi:hypothetical protein
VFFLGLSATAILVLPRASDATVFRAPLHPLPILVFLVLIAAILVLFTMNRPVQTLLGGLVVALGIPAARFLPQTRAR